MRLRLLMRALVCLLVLLAPAAIGAQADPPRPGLPAGSDGNDWELYFDRGVLLFQKSPMDAAPYFHWASRIDPSRAEPYFARWANYLFRADNEEVYDYIRGEESLWRKPAFLAADSLRVRAFMRNPFVHRALEVLVYDRLPGEFSASRDTRAWLAYTEGKFSQALGLAARSVERGGPRALGSRYDRALIAVAAGEMTLALTDLRTLVDELRKLDEKQMVRFYASKEQLLYMIGLLHNQLGDRVAARAAFGEALVEDAAFAYGYAGLAAMSRVGRQHAQAATEYAQAIELAPDDGHLRLLQAQTLFDLQRYEPAAIELERAIALEPWYAAPQYLMGRVRERQGREADAIRHYERFVALASQKDPIAKNMRFRLELRARSDTAKRP